MENKISEIFYAIQGEGQFTGCPAVFLRFYGCNLDCDFCDEPLHKIAKKNMTDNEIIDEVKKYNTNIVILTGGEPTLYDLNSLILKLKKIGKRVHVETNGYSLKNIKEADFITYSPKSKELKKIDFKDYEVKFVVGLGEAIDHILDFAEREKVFIQPKSKGDMLDLEAIKYCAELCTKYNIRLSIQTHKVYNGR